MTGRPAPDFAALIAGLAEKLEEHGFPFMLIGGQAVLLHGRPRLTEDIDVTLGADVSRLSGLLTVCAELGFRVLPEHPRRFAEETSVLPALDPPSGIRVDFIFSTTAYERQAIERAVHVDLAGRSVPFASAEDLILHKLFAGRPRDHEDATGVVRRRGKDLNWEYLERWGREFAQVPGREDLPARIARLKGEETSP
jgi:hypothetical protein